MLLDKKLIRSALWMCIVMLCFAILSGWSYGYYTLLRWAVCLTTGYLAYDHYQKGHSRLPLVFGGLAVLFNPIAPIHLSKAEWAMLDFFVAMFLLLYVTRENVVKLKLRVGKSIQNKLLLGVGLLAVAITIGIIYVEDRRPTAKQLPTLLLAGEIVQIEGGSADFGIRDRYGFVTPIHLTEHTKVLLVDGSGGKAQLLNRGLKVGSHVETEYVFDQQTAKRYALKIVIQPPQSRIGRLLQGIAPDTN